jgi:hypothetical protein
MDGALFGDNHNSALSRPFLFILAEQMSEEIFIKKNIEMGINNSDFSKSMYYRYTKSIQLFCEESKVFC